MSKKGIRGEAHWVGDYSVKGAERCRGTRGSALGSTGPQVVGSVLIGILVDVAAAQACLMPPPESQARSPLCAGCAPLEARIVVRPFR